jgi:hypothetical protein
MFSLTTAYEGHGAAIYENWHASPVIAAGTPARATAHLRYFSALVAVSDEAGETDVGCSVIELGSGFERASGPARLSATCEFVWSSHGRSIALVERRSGEGTRTRKASAQQHPYVRRRRIIVMAPQGAG